MTLIATISSVDIKADVIEGSHIANNEVTLDKFKPGEITASMFSGVLPSPMVAPVFHRFVEPLDLL